MAPGSYGRLKEGDIEELEQPLRELGQLLSYWDLKRLLLAASWTSWWDHPLWLCPRLWKAERILKKIMFLNGGTYIAQLNFLAGSLEGEDVSDRVARLLNACEPPYNRGTFLALLAWASTLCSSTDKSEARRKAERVAAVFEDFLKGVRGESR
ncbi:LH2 [Bearded dragon adenovirus 1]|uniref:LH2 n=1 Tax=Bearded dragon adenovirus 1 TaxID=2729647 RepID=A0A6M4MKF2_9ADEN|nr:LH2 [Bearded dragon adenovirus 1]QJR83085.1 LH2 [Bearded dragon adenovirus 1]QPN96203.1 LH2 [Bearded dragon adenovirus 1]